MKLFHICTIANDLTMYEQMKQSFLAAGFDETRCRYSLFDNSKDNVHDPFATLNLILAQTEETYIIYCHQDILLNQGHGFDQLMQMIEEVDRLDPDWAVLGNAGFSYAYEWIVKITDPNQMPDYWSGGFPQEVHSLDENFLVIKPSAKAHCSPDLKGFHFYGADLCLNAILNGYSCYVIGFHLTHLSGGNQNQVFYNSRTKFAERWSREFTFCYLKPVCGPVLLLSKYRWLQKLLSQNRKINKAIGWWLFCHSPLQTLMNLELRRRQFACR